MSKEILYAEGLVRIIFNNPIVRSITIMSGAIYLCGYIINTVFLRSIGIETNTLVKSEFVETGMMFAFLTGAVMSIPISSFFSLRDIRKEMNLNCSLRIIAPLSFTVLNFCFILVFFALFIKGDEFHSLAFSWEVPKVYISTIFFYYLFIIILGLMLCFFLEKKRSGSSTVNEGINYYFFSTYVAFVIVSIFFDYKLIERIPWIWEGIKHSRFYLLLVVVMGVILYWVNARYSEFSNPKAFQGLGILSGITLVTLFYIAMTTYIYTTYKNLPMSRGGTLPEVRVQLTITREVALSQPDIIKTKQKETAITKLLYLIEQNNENLFLIAKYYPFASVSSYGKVYVIKRKDVISMHYEKQNARKREKTIEDLNKAIELDPENVSAIKDIFELKIITGNYEGALESITKALSLSPDLEDEAVVIYLECIAKKLLNMDTSETEVAFNEILEKDFTINWSFEMFESWLEDTDIDDDTKLFITEKTEELKKHKKR